MISIILAGVLFCTFMALVFFVQKYHTKSKECATLTERLIRVPELEARYQEQQQIAQDLRLENTKLITQMESERKQWLEQREFTTHTHQRMSDQFQVLADQIFENKSAKFTKLNQEGLETILKPMHVQLKELERDRISLIKEIQDLKSLNKKMSEDAINLTTALKGDNKMQGNWGELILERILERSGLTRGQEYDVQISMAHSDEKRYQPDVIIHLPENKEIIIDSKVSLVSYERFCNESDPVLRDKSLLEHIASIRNHIKILSDKAYQNLKGIHTLDFVLMFMPIETALTIAMQSDPNLFSEALEKNIVIVSPTTLLATLRTIQNIWKFEYQNRNALAIATAGGLLYDKFVGFVDDFNKIGKQLNDTQKTFDTALNKLSSGRGNLIKKAEDMKNMGIKNSKQLPQDLVDAATDIETELTPITAPA
jgi:DNA recombination protein RmuC